MSLHQPGYLWNLKSAWGVQGIFRTFLVKAFRIWTITKTKPIKAKIKNIVNKILIFANFGSTLASFVSKSICFSWGIQWWSQKFM